MARRASTHPTDGELELLQVLWQSGPCSLGEICRTLRLRRPVATTTVATILKVMLDKQLVHRKRTTRGYLWSAKSTRQTTAAGMVRKLVDSVFDGSAQRLVTHLLESHPLSAQQQAEIRRLIDTEGKREK